MDCQLGYFTVYEDWAKDKVTQSDSVKFTLFHDRLESGFVTPPPPSPPTPSTLQPPPTDHRGHGTLRVGGQSCAVRGDDPVLTAGGRDGNDPKLKS